MEYSVGVSMAKRQIESPTQIEPMTSLSPVGHSNHGTIRRLVASEVIFTPFDATRVLHTAGISKVQSTVCGNKARKRVNVKLGKR